MSDVQVVVVPADELQRIRLESAEIRRQLERLQQSLRGNLHKRWFTLPEAAEIKGVSYDVLRKRPRRYRPNFGRSTCLIDESRRYKEVYHYSEVLTWAELTEAEIDQAYKSLLQEGVDE